MEGELRLLPLVPRVVQEATDRRARAEIVAVPADPDLALSCPEDLAGGEELIPGGAGLGELHRQALPRSSRFRWRRPQPGAAGADVAQPAEQRREPLGFRQHELIAG